MRLLEREDCYIVGRGEEPSIPATMQSTYRSDDDKVVKNGEGNDGSEVVDDAEKNQQKSGNAEFSEVDASDDAKKKNLEGMKGSLLRKLKMVQRA